MVSFPNVLVFQVGKSAQVQVLFMPRDYQWFKLLFVHVLISQFYPTLDSWHHCSKKFRKPTNLEGLPIHWVSKEWISMNLYSTQNYKSHFSKQALTFTLFQIKAVKSVSQLFTKYTGKKPSHTTSGCYWRKPCFMGKNITRAQKE